MKETRRVALPLYLVAFVLILFPILDLFQVNSPVRLDDVGWRTVAAGLLSRLMLTPILGLLLIYIAALLLEQRRILKVLAVFDIVLALAIMAGMVAYAMDALEMRTQIGPNARENYDLGLIFSFVKYTIVLVLLMIFAVVQWKTGSALARAARRTVTSASPLVVRKSSQPAPVEAEVVSAEGAQLADRE